MSLRRIVGFLSGLMVIAVALLVASTSASAQGKEQTEFVVAWALPADAPPDTEVRTEVFRTLRQAAYVATGGAILLEDDATFADLARELQSLERTLGRSSFAETTIGIDYDGANYSSGGYIWTVSNSVGCSTGTTYSVSSMPSGWNDRVSSAQAFGGCNTFVHYANTGLGGDSITCTCSSMGTMNNRTSSERWAP